jgi:hypothetical protein
VLKKDLITTICSASAHSCVALCHFGYAQLAAANPRKCSMLRLIELAGKKMSRRLHNRDKLLLRPTKPSHFRFLIFFFETSEISSRKQTFDADSHLEFPFHAKLSATSTRSETRGEMKKVSRLDAV